MDIPDASLGFEEDVGLRTEGQEQAICLCQRRAQVGIDGEDQPAALGGCVRLHHGWLQ